MSNAVATIGLVYDSTDVQHSDFGIFLELTHGLNEVPKVRGVDTIVPGRVGRIAGSRILDVLSIFLEGVVLGDDVSDFRTNMLALRTLFDPTAMPADLVAFLEDGSTATISARPLNIVPIMTSSMTANVSVELESVDPVWVIV